MFTSFLVSGSGFQVRPVAPFDSVTDSRVASVYLGCASTEKVRVA